MAFSKAKNARSAGQHVLKAWPSLAGLRVQGLVPVMFEARLGGWQAKLGLGALVQGFQRRTVMQSNLF